jgi:peptide/nickel transport system substrate-binding protein
LLLLALLPAPARAQNTPTLTIGTIEPILSVDPAASGDVFSWEVLTHLYTGLTRQIPGTLRYELALAASHTVSTDGLIHTLTIRPDAAFDDGTPITARTFADSINRVFALKAAGSVAVAPYIRSAAVDTSGALVLTLTSPIPYLEQLLALPPYFPAHPAIFKAGALNDKPQQLIGNGIYKLESFGADGSITLIANPAWKGTPPATPRIVIRSFLHPADLREALKVHQVDIAWRGLPPDDTANVAQVKGIRQIESSGTRVFYLLVDQQESPFNDPIARQGLPYLIDREAMAQIDLKGTGVPLYTILPRELAASASPTYPQFGLDRAAETLGKGGYSRFKRIEADLISGRQMFGDDYSEAVDTLVNQLLQHEAFVISRRDLEPRALVDAVTQGGFQLALVGWTPIVPHPDAILRPLLHSQGELAKSAGYTDPALDRLLDQAALATDSAQQAAGYAQVQSAALQDIVAIPLWQSRQWLFAWDNVQDITVEPNYLLRYDRLKIQSGSTS